MFGATTIIGNTVIKTDDKSRIIIPSFTGVEKGDKLVLVKKDNFYEIMKLETLEKRINELENKIRITESKEAYEYFKCLLDELYLNIVCKDTIADRSNRFNSHQWLESKTAYRVIGAKESIYIIKDEEYQKKR